MLDTTHTGNIFPVARAGSDAEAHRNFSAFEGAVLVGTNLLCSVFSK